LQHLKPQAAAAAVAQVRLQQQQLLEQVTPATTTAILFETRSSAAALDEFNSTSRGAPDAPTFPEFVKRRPVVPSSPPLSASSSSSSSWLGSQAFASSPVPLPAWYADLVYLIYIAASIMQIVDMDPVGMLCPSYSCTNQYIGAPSGAGDDGIHLFGGHAATEAGGPITAELACQHPGPSTMMTMMMHGTATTTTDLPPVGSTYDHRQSAGFRRWYDYHRVLRALELGPCSLPSSSSSSSSSSSFSRGSTAPPCTGGATMGGTGNSNVVRVSTVVTHCILAGLAMLVRITDADAFLAPARVLARGFVFYALCVAWTYAVGIRDACISIRRYPYYVNPMAQAALPSPSSCGKDDDDNDDGDNNRALSGRLASILPPYVQPFAPCQLRFAVLLFADRWHFLAAAIGSALIVGERIHRVAFSCGQHGHAASHMHHQNNGAAKDVVAMSPVEEHEGNVRRLRTQKRKNAVRVKHHLNPLHPHEAVASSNNSATVRGSAASDAHLFQLAFAGAAAAASSSSSPSFAPSSISFSASAAAASPSSLLVSSIGNDRARGGDLDLQDVEEEEEEEDADENGDEKDAETEEDEHHIARMFRLAREQRRRGEMI
jgi:hypothetical protein